MWYWNKKWSASGGGEGVMVHTQRGTTVSFLLHSFTRARASALPKGKRQQKLLLLNALPLPLLLSVIGSLWRNGAQRVVFFFWYPKTVVPNLLTLGVPPSCHRDLFAADHLVRKTNKIDKYTRSGQEQSASGHIIHNVVCRKVRASGIRREDKVSHAAYAHRVFV